MSDTTLATLRKNMDKNFVQRIVNADDWPKVQNPDGSFSTHRMASASVNGKNIAFPTLFYDPEQNALYAPENPIGEAIKRGEFIEFPNEKSAQTFAEGRYKAGFNTGVMQQMLHPKQSALDQAMKKILGK